MLRVSIGHVHQVGRNPPGPDGTNIKCKGKVPLAFHERAQQDAIKVVLPNSDSCLGWTRVQLCSGWLPILLVHEMNQILRRSQGVLGLEEKRLLTRLQILADHGLDGSPSSPPPPFARREHG